MGRGSQGAHWPCKSMDLPACCFCTHVEDTYHPHQLHLMMPSHQGVPTHRKLHRSLPMLQHDQPSATHNAMHAGLVCVYSGPPVCTAVACCALISTAPNSQLAFLYVFMLLGFVGLYVTMRSTAK